MWRHLISSIQSGVLATGLLLVLAGGCSRSAEQTAAQAVESLLDSEQPRAAAETLTVCLRQYPDSVRLRQLNFLVLLQLEQLEQAVSVLASLPPKDPILQQALRHRQIPIRTGAAALLAQHALPIGCHALEDALADPHASVRQQAALAVGRRPECRPLRSLYRLLQDDSLAVRLAAVQAFGMRHEERAAGWLVTQLGHSDPQYREAVNQALWQVASPANRPVLVKAFAQARPQWQLGLALALAKLQDRTALPFLLQSARSGQTNDRIQAIQLLGHYPEGAAQAMLSNLLHDAEPSVRQSAQLALQNRPTPTP